MIQQIKQQDYRHFDIGVYISPAGDMRGPAGEVPNKRKRQYASQKGLPLTIVIIIIVYYAIKGSMNTYKQDNIK